MNPADILIALRADGFVLTAEGDRIRIDPGDRLTDEAFALIGAHKVELLQLLRAANEPAPPAPVVPEPGYPRLDDLDPEGRATGERIYWALLSPRPKAEPARLARPDDRHHCRECSNLSRWVCTAAKRIGALEGYRPVDTPPRRCEGMCRR